MIHSEKTDRAISESSLGAVRMRADRLPGLMGRDDSSLL